MKRLSRPEQNQRNRALVLAAARRIFLTRGYHGATLDEIADEAGFSRGVVQSQFGNKADLFLALLEDRIDERAAENARLVQGLSGAAARRALAEHVARREQGELEWGLLLIEFRVHAARDPALNRRFATAHARTLHALAGVIAATYQRAGQLPPVPPDQMAQLLLMVTNGAKLEQVADPDGAAQRIAFELLDRLAELPAQTGNGTPKQGRQR